MRWHWQYLVPWLLLISSIDWVIMPMLKISGLDGWRFFLITILIATPKLFCWFWFWNWFKKTAILEIALYKLSKNQDLQEGIKLGEEIKEELQKRGLAERATDYLYKMHAKYTDKNNKIIKYLERGGHGAMFALGLAPYSIGRAIGVTFCATMGWRRGLCTLAVGNVLQIGYMVGAWDWFFSIFKN